MNQPVTWKSPHAERADAARNRRLLLVTARVAPGTWPHATVPAPARPGADQPDR